MNKVNIYKFHRKCIKEYCINKCVYFKDCLYLYEDKGDKDIFRFAHEMCVRYEVANTKEMIKVIYKDCLKQQNKFSV